MNSNKLGNRLYDTTHPIPAQPRSDMPEIGAFGINQSTLRRFIGLIELGALIVNSMIGLRFLLKLMAANPANVFAQLIYFLTAPFLAIFVGLTQTPSFEGIVIEFYDLIAILFYFVLAWAVSQLSWILFARIKS